MENWISIKEALKISKRKDGPTTANGLVWAGTKGGFIRKAEDGFHWEFNEIALIRYCEISNKPSLTSIAEELGVNVGSVKYAALKHGIPFRKEMNRKYLEPSDAKKIIRLIKESQ